MKRSRLLLLAILGSGSLLQAFGQGMAASPAAPSPSSGKIGSTAIWQPPEDFLTKAHSVCDKVAGPQSFSGCFINQMSVSGAPADAVAFTRMFFARSDGQIGIMNAFRTFGRVDAAQVFFPLRANDNFGLLLVNGDPSILDVDDLKKLDQASMQQNPMFLAIKKQFPGVDVWPGDRSGSSAWPRSQSLPGGGTEFIVSYPLINGCHACEHVGMARYGWDFDANGKFLKTVYIPTPPPPKLLNKPRTPLGASPPPQQ